MERDYISERVYWADQRRLLDWRWRTEKSGRKAAARALTKEALSLVVLLSSLGAWAVIWTAAGSMAFAWLQ